MDPNLSSETRPVYLLFRFRSSQVYDAAYNSRYATKQVKICISVLFMKVQRLKWQKAIVKRVLCLIGSVNYTWCFVLGATTPTGLGPPHYWGFAITDAPHLVELLWMSDRPDAETRTWQTQHSQEADIHAPDGIRTHNPNKILNGNWIICWTLRR
jgi:hypothetical protein